MQDDRGEGRVAHDLRNILMIISGNLSLLARSIGDDAVARKHIERAMAGVDLGTRLARSVIEADQHALTTMRTDLRTMEASLGKVLGDAAGDGIEISIEVPPVIAPIAVDRAALENVLVNLTVNARHAMRGMGELRISFAEDRCDGRRMVRMTVVDTGCGMSDDVLAKMFEPYFTTKGAAGSGLGLATVRRFANGCGGTVEVDSTVGKGTAISILMPVVSFAS